MSSVPPRTHNSEFGASNVDWKGGVVNAAFVYGPYGEILDSIGGQEDEHLRRFNGKESDEVSSLSYYGYRYYDELSLSWTQADPLYVAAPDIAGANPREMTLYAFSLNNPIRYMDPDGLQASGDGWNCPDCTGGETVIIYGLPIDDPKSSENSLEEGLKQEAYRIQNGLRAQVNAIWYSGEKKKRGSYGWDWEGHRRLANAVHKRVANVILGAYLCNTPSSCLKGAVFSAAGGLAGKGLSALVKTKMAQKLAAKMAAKVSSLFAKCFAAGTLIETEDGLRPIEEIEIGDLVWSRDDKTGEEAWKPVVQLFITPNAQLLDLDLIEADGDEQELLVTAEHPLWTTDGWTAIGDLAIGDAVWARDGWAEVVSVANTGQHEIVYNLEVADFHSYFVGDGGVWAHNTCNPAKAIASLQKRLAEHEAKLAEFVANPTVRPGMEHLSQSVIHAAQQARVKHLQDEISAFAKGIRDAEKLL